MSLPAYPLGFDSSGNPTSGLKIEVRKSLHWKTDTQTSASEIEARSGFQSTLRRSFDLHYGLLTTAQVATLESFFNSCKGKLYPFTIYLRYPAGTQITARFDTDDLDIDFDETGRATAATIPFREVLGEGP